ncbi:MAG: phosphatidylglycerophosphatase A [Erysipelotrichales bacterium]|nr:phosphatidylglycerophosphatase A [Erysipelotrichales bacterium]
MVNYKLTEKCINLLKSRGVELRDIADCVMFLQSKYVPNLSIEECEAAVRSVLEKNEVQNAILTGIAVDIMAEEGKLPYEELQSMLCNDEPLYGLDEVVAYGICNLYGSIALTNFGYIDKEKIGIISKLNNHEGPQVNTFLDDIVGAIAASAASKIAHGGKRIDVDL